MINAWSLAWEVLNGTMDETYPIREDVPEKLWGTPIDDKTGLWKEPQPYPYELGNQDDGLDYEVDLSSIDDQYAHHFTNANSPYNDGWTQEFHQQQLEELKMSAHYFKYHEKEILKDIEEYVSGTYKGHYTGNSHEYRNVQTLDLMASKDLASSFCQANILKYGSRYGNKDGKNKKDLMKVIHYAMLLAHFDGHYGEPSMPSGNFEQMP